jgi:hypothetical protein
MQVLSQKHVLNLDWGVMERHKGKRVGFMPENFGWTIKKLSAARVLSLNPQLS